MTPQPQRECCEKCTGTIGVGPSTVSETHYCPCHSPTAEIPTSEEEVKAVCLMCDKDLDVDCSIHGKAWLNKNPTIEAAEWEKQFDEKFKLENGFYDFSLSGDEWEDEKAARNIKHFIRTALEKAVEAATDTHHLCICKECSDAHSKMQKDWFESGKAARTKEVLDEMNRLMHIDGKVVKPQDIIGSLPEEVIRSTLSYLVGFLQSE